MNTKIHVSVVLMHEGKVCLVLEQEGPNKGLWNLPGGHLEFGESPAQGARREMLEETGIDVSFIGLLSIYSRVWNEGKTHGLRFVFAAKVENSTARKGDLPSQTFLPEDLARIPDSALVSPQQLRDSVKRALAREWVSLALLSD